MTRQSWEEDTRPNLLRPSLKQRAAESVPPQDDDSTLGMLMRQTVNNTAAVQALRTDMDVLSREVRQHNRAAPVSIQSSAKHASNRMAALMAALFTIYEVTSPWLRELIRQVVHR
jgi:hypothetical protein